MSATLRYRYSDRQGEIHAEFICQRHYDAGSQPGGFFAPLTDAEKRQGKSQQVTPYSGDRPCALCSEEAETALPHLSESI